MSGMFGLVMLTSLVTFTVLPIHQRSAAESFSSQRHPESLELESLSSKAYPPTWENPNLDTKPQVEIAHSP